MFAASFQSGFKPVRGISLAQWCCALRAGGCPTYLLNAVLMVYNGEARKARGQPLARLARILGVAVD